jgi:hypothetical protein
MKWAVQKTIFGDSEALWNFEEFKDALEFAKEEMGDGYTEKFSIVEFAGDKIPVVSLVRGHLSYDIIPVGGDDEEAKKVIEAYFGQVQWEME